MSRVSPSMAVALLALFVALGGTGYAAAKLNGRNIVNGSITGKKLRHNTLGGRQVKESSLGKVPSASDSDQLDGRPASAYQLAGNAVANAAHLDGFDATAFLPASGTAVNAGALQGHPASDFLPAGRLQSAGPVSLAVGDAATLFAAGPLALVARCLDSGGNRQAEVELQHTVTLLDPTSTGGADLQPPGVAILARAVNDGSRGAVVGRQSFAAFPAGAPGLQGTATAIATTTGCTAAAYAVTSS